MPAKGDDASALANPPRRHQDNSTKYKQMAVTRETDPLIVVRSPHGADKTALTVIAEPNDSPAAIDVDALQQEPLPLSWKARAKAFVAEYGAVGIVTHTIISFTVIAIAYVCVSNGVNVGALLSAIGLEGDTSKGSKAHAAGAFVIAYAIFKVLAPVRIPLTFAITPVIMRALRKRGYMLPPSGSANASLSSPSAQREAAIERV